MNANSLPVLPGLWNDIAVPSSLCRYEGQRILGDADDSRFGIFPSSYCYMTKCGPVTAITGSAAGNKQRCDHDTIGPDIIDYMRRFAYDCRISFPDGRRAARRDFMR